MSTESKPSFTPGLKWSIGLNVFLIVIIVLAVTGMLNYLSRDYFFRFHLNTRNHDQLSSLTTKLLQSITNKVNVTIFYDKDEPFYTTVNDLLRQYSLANSRISVRTVDYLRDPAAAQRIKTEYDITAQNATNWVIFECEGRKFPVDGNTLTQWATEQVPNTKEPEFRKRPVAFLGEQKFTGAILTVTNPKQLNAYYLTGHGEQNPVTAYSKFIEVVANNAISVRALSLLATNTIPQDCNLIIIAGATAALFTNELDKIEQYLFQGGRMLVLFDFNSFDPKTLTERTGLDKVLAKWGVEVGAAFVQDAERAVTQDSLMIREFNPRHPIVNALLDSALYLALPRPIFKANSQSQAPDAPKVDELAFTGPKGFLLGSKKYGRYPVMAAVEKGAIRNVVTERGATRLVIIGDSVIFNNQGIENLMNRAFAGYVINWLLDRTQMLQGVGARRVSEYHLVMTKSQMQTTQWILLAGMPGCVLLLGALVWLRRRR